MKSNRPILLASIVLVAAAATACTRTDTGSTQATAASSLASAAEAVEVNAPIPHNDIDLTFSTVGTPVYNADTDTLSYTVNIANNGKASLASSGTYPVNVGVVILGADGSLNTPPAKQDFVRIHLPHGLAPGQTLDLPVKFKVAPTLGGTVIVDAVQERVAWFRGYKKPVLTLGTFARCNANEKSACTSDGAAIASAQ